MAAPVARDAKKRCHGRRSGEEALLPFEGVVVVIGVADAAVAASSVRRVSMAIAGSR